ncbi:hypothetical protein [Streptomyces mirabilis]|uniref:hypothetical protein n=1 Tax=Streptomyces mirabilis TaxID=68239 RepID=UPI00369696D3
MPSPSSTPVTRPPDPRSRRTGVPQRKISDGGPAATDGDWAASCTRGEHGRGLDIIDLDAARLLDLTPEALAAELIALMLRSGAVVLRDGRLHAAAEHTPVEAETRRVPYPRAWPTPEPR